MKKLLIVLTFGLSFSLLGQNYGTQQRQIAVVNIAFGGLTGGIGSMINKPKEESLGRAFIRGASRGMVGGTIGFIGKNCLGNISSKNPTDNRARTILKMDHNYKTYWYGIGSKLIHTTGISIIENAGRHQGFLENWTCEVSMLRINIETKTFKPSIRIQIFQVYYLAKTIATKEFSLSKSIQTGVPYFHLDSMDVVKGNAQGSSGDGIVLVAHNSLGIDEHTVTAHELVHTLQTRERSALSTFTFSLSNKLKSKSKVYNYCSKFLYFDPVYADPLKDIQYRSGYYGAYFEMEAAHIAKHMYIY